MESNTNSLQVVRVSKGGSKCAVILNGNIILTADSTAGERCSNVSTVANNLAQALCIDISLIFHETQDDWSWEKIAMELKGERGTLFSKLRLEGF